MPNHAQSSRWRYPDPDCLYSRGWHWWSTKRTLLIAVLTTRTLKNLVAERGTLVESYKTGAHWATFRLTFVLKALKHGTPWTTYRLAILRQRPCQSSSTYTRFYVGSMGVAILGCSTNVFFFFLIFERRDAKLTRPSNVESTNPTIPMRTHAPRLCSFAR